MLLIKEIKLDNTRTQNSELLREKGVCLVFTLITSMLVKIF